MNVLIDTNVVLDILLRRKPYYEDAARVNVLSEKGYIGCYISASAVTDIFYIARKELKDKDAAIALLKKFLQANHIASVTENNIHTALDLNWNDFEDSLQYVTGQAISAQYLITRNAKDFTGSEIAVVSPAEFLGIITSQN